MKAYYKIPGADIQIQIYWEKDKKTFAQKKRLQIPLEILTKVNTPKKDRILELIVAENLPPSDTFIGADYSIQRFPQDLKSWEAIEKIIIFTTQLLICGCYASHAKI